MDGPGGGGEVNMAAALAPATERDELTRRLQYLMVGRLVVATVLLGGTMLLALDQELGAAAFTPRFLLALIIATYSASLGFAVWLPRARRLDRFSAVQIGWDLGLSTGLIYVAGGASSGFTFLYGVAVLMAALVVGPRAAHVATIAALLLYTLMSLALADGWLPPPPDQPVDRYELSQTDATFTIVVNICGLLLVAFLAGNLAGRLRATGGQLREAAAQAAVYARLNEDIIRSLTSGLITTDPELRVRTVNPTGQEIFGTRATTMVGRPLSELFLDEEALAPGTRRMEGSARRADGTRFPVGFTKTPLLDQDSVATGELFVFQDLSEITALREAAERAERLAALGRLSAGLAHEIRNPLGSISGSVQLVHESPALDEEERRLMGIVLKEVDRLDDLVTTMLHVGRPRPPNFAPTDLGALASDVVEVARRDLAHHEAEVVCEAQPGTMAWVDSDQIRQVIWNLLKNAVQHSPSEGVVRLKVYETDSRDAAIEVSDQGRGVPAEARDHLFDMFYSRRATGVGLGLALVDQIARAHKGSVQLVSPVGEGACFRVTLPRVDEEQAASQ